MAKKLGLDSENLQLVIREGYRIIRSGKLGFLIVQKQINPSPFFSTSYSP